MGGGIEAEVLDIVTRGEWIAIAAFLISILGWGINIGVVYANVQEHERRLEMQEKKMDQIIPQVARIDLNVSFLAERAREDRERYKQ